MGNHSTEKGDYWLASLLVLNSFLDFSFSGVYKMFLKP